MQIVGECDKERLWKEDEDAFTYSFLCSSDAKKKRRNSFPYLIEPTHKFINS